MAKSKLNVSKKNIGTVLLIVALLLVVNVPLVDEKTIALILVILVAAYNLFM